MPAGIRTADVSDASVKKALQKALADDDRLSREEVASIIRETLDAGIISSQEIADLRTIATRSKTIDTNSRDMLNRFADIALDISRTSGAVAQRWFSDVDQKIFDFMGVAGRGAFPHFDRFEIGLGMLANIRNPGRINQGPSSLCGPSDLLFCVCRDVPEKYVDFAINLYNNGRAKLGNLSIEPGTDCRNYNLPRSQIWRDMWAIDWMTAASIRDSENWFFDYQHVGNQLAGMTLPGEMGDWFKKVGYSDVYVSGELFRLTGQASETLVDKANNLFAKGYRVCLLINDQLMYWEKQGNRSMVARHWVVLQSTINKSPSVSFQVFSWGRGRYPVPNPDSSGKTKSLTMSNLREHLFSIVAAKY